VPVDVFAGVPEQELRQAGRRRKFSRGEVVFHEGDVGDSVHRVTSGRFAARITTPLGDVAMFAVHSPGEVFGLLAVLHPESRRTATVGALEAAKAHSAVEAWAGALQDTLEQAFVYTEQWLGLTPSHWKRVPMPTRWGAIRRLFGLSDAAPTLGSAGQTEVAVHTDFGVDIDGGQDMAELLKARMAGEISRETYWDEMLRRGKLGPQFDPKEEQDRLDQEMVDVAIHNPLTHPLDPKLPPGANGAANQRSAAA